ncbi:MAG: NAD(P)/FAD-dependent oxidoreductase, partial [Gemmatimonadota bacterium]|nr:NAD(P)/FAD-dependent oxidoreductase [Gemmatimonadota bacterium]
AMLARAGRRTLVLEARDTPGGCAATEELWPGHFVDTGAHSLTALDPRVTPTGLEFVTPDPLVVALQPGGPSLAVSADPTRTASSIARFSERDAAAWPRFMEAMERAGRVLEVLYRTPPPRVVGGDRGDLWELARLALRLGRVGRADVVELMRLVPMTVQEMLEEWFESDLLLGALAARGCRGIAQGPMAAGTAFVMIHGLIGGAGNPRATRWVRGGLGRLGTTLERAAREAGAEIRTGARVERILVDDGRASGVALASGEVMRASVVASSADPRHTLLELVDPVHLDPEVHRQIRNIRFRGVCSKVHLALDGLPEGPWDSFPPSLCVAPGIRYLERAWDDAKHGSPSRHPALDVLVPTLLDPSLAPGGRHIASVLVQYTPHRRSDGEWDDVARDALTDSVVETLDACLPGLADRVVERHAYTPADLETRFGLTEGNIHHGEMTLDQILIGRPIAGFSRYAMPIEGLWACGAGAHPGGGLTGSPGMNASQAILG